MIKMFTVKHFWTITSSLVIFFRLSYFESQLYSRTSTHFLRLELQINLNLSGVERNAQSAQDDVKGNLEFKKKNSLHLSKISF